MHAPVSGKCVCGVKEESWCCRWARMHSRPQVHTYTQHIAVTFALCTSPVLTHSHRFHAHIHHGRWALPSREPSHASTLLQTRTPAVNKPSKNHPALTSLFFLFLCPHLYPLLTQALLSGPRNLAHSEKHSRKAFSPPDQGDFLIHSLLCFDFTLVCVCVCVRARLLFSALHRKIQQLLKMSPGWRNTRK